MTREETQPQGDDQPREREVFVTANDRRARRLRRGAFAMVLLACLWIIGLGVGMFGFGGLPGISLIRDNIRDNKDRPDRVQQASAVERFSPVVRSISAEASRAVVVAASQEAARFNARSRGVRARRAPGRTGPPPAAAQEPVNAAGRTRGWARQGLPAPPGRLRRTQPPPPPAQGQGQGQGQGQSQGRGRGQTTTTTTTPLPPGQAKKAPPPPPEG